MGNDWFLLGRLNRKVDRNGMVMEVIRYVMMVMMVMMDMGNALAFLLRCVNGNSMPRDATGHRLHGDHHQHQDAQQNGSHKMKYIA